MKKIVIISGSPRCGGNTDSITKLAAKISGEAGAEVEVFQIREQKINSCLGCNFCKGNGGLCVHQDDMTHLLAKLKKCNGILLAAPIYFGYIPGTAKVLIDRLYALFDPGKEFAAYEVPGKKLGIVLPFGGGPAEEYAKVAEQVAYCFRVAGISGHKTVLCGQSNESGEFSHNRRYQEEVKALTEWLME